MPEEPIQAWVIDQGSKDGLDRGLKRIDVDPGKVRDALTRLTRLLPQDDEAADGRLQRWRMTEVTLSLELSAEAGVTLIGSTSVSVSGAIEATFTRVEA